MALKDINFNDIKDAAKDVAEKVGEATRDTVEKLKRKDILTAPFMVEMIRTATNMYDHGWDERNGGNISLMVDEEEIAKYMDLTEVIREIPTGFDAPALDGKYFLVTGTGKYFKNVRYAPEVNLGLIRIKDSGRTAELLWGYADGGKFTSELPAHLMSHAARLEVNPENRVVMHCHPGNLLAMTYVHDLDEKAFTRTLWQMCTECIVVFPEGVNVLPWMLCGTNEIGVATAEKMKTARLVVWSQHGIYGAGKDLDETFGLIETQHHHRRGHVAPVRPVRADAQGGLSGPAPGVKAPKKEIL